MKKKLLFFLLPCIAVISFFGYHQYKVENYISDQKVEYNILVGKERKKYTPYIIFLLKNLNKEKTNLKYIDFPYLLSFSDYSNNLKRGKEVTRLSNRYYDLYMIEVYYNQKEIGIMKDKVSMEFPYLI